MNEDTIIRTIPLRDGRRWEWFADANVIGLAPGLTEAEQDEAICELQAEWRRKGLRVIHGGGLGMAVAAVGVAVLEIAPVLTSHLGV